ncbi:MAG: hypothetical protein LBQ31_07715 [Bacteroidales bacterium]|jgi:hypothetical protein|nr:hypothetical protein [Bacteroidales bacterium]
MKQKIIYTVIALLCIGSISAKSQSDSTNKGAQVVPDLNQLFDTDDLLRSVFTYRINYVSDNFLAGILGNKKLRQTMDLFYKYTGCGTTVRARMGQGGIYAMLFTPHKDHGVSSQNPESDFHFNISLIPKSKNSTVCKAVITWNTGFYSNENNQWHYDNAKISPSSFETFSLYMKDSVIDNLSLPYLEAINTYLVNAISILMGEKASMIDADILLGQTVAVDSFCSSQLLNNGYCENVAWHSAKKGQSITVSGSVSDKCSLKDNNKDIKELTRNDSTFQLSLTPSAGEHRYKISTAMITQAQANLVVYDEQTYKVVLLPVGTINTDADAVKQMLNNIYRPSIVKFDVSIDNSMRDYNKNISVENIAPEEIYHSSMQDVIFSYKNKVSTDKKTFYIFLFSEFKNNSSGVGGYMPYKQQFGFIDMKVAASASGAMLHKTIAHELAHGVFGLKHTSDNNEYGIPFGQNLLDYSESTALCKFQWDIIHDPYAGQTEMDDPEEAMLLWRDIVWITDLLYGFVPDNLESEAEKYLSILQTVENNYSSYIEQYKTKNVGIDGWNIPQKNETAGKEKSIYSLYKHISEGSNHVISQRTNDIILEQYSLNGKKYDLALYSLVDNPSLAYSNIKLQGYASLKNNTFVKAGYTKKSGFIVFYKNEKPIAMLQCMSSEEPKMAIKHILNYMLLVEQNGGQQKKDDDLVFYWDYLAEGVYSKESVRGFWASEAQATEVDLSGDISFYTQMNEQLLTNGCCTNVQSCCRCACIKMMENSKNKVTPNSSYTDQILAIDASVLNDTCSNITTDYDGLSNALSLLDISLFEHKRPMMITVYHPKVVSSDVANGVCYVKKWTHKCSGNTPGANSHFIVVVGKKYDNAKKQYYYTFFDPGTSQNNLGASNQNRLYIAPDNVTGGTHYTQGGGYYYQLTGVRKNLNYTY